MIKFFKKEQLKASIFLLPNLLTTGNLFFGFYSIGKSLKGDFELAAYGIMIATIFDILDGRVARLTKGTSEFGVQYDSLCDLISFGLAPALLAYQIGIYQLGKVGWILCFLFLACGALRLARFNIHSYVKNFSTQDFIGLPIPMAALFIVCFIQTILEFREQIKVRDNTIFNSIAPIINDPTVMISVLFISLPLLSLLMVSNISYLSHKSIKIKNIKPFKLLVILVVSIAVLAYQPGFLGFILVFLYVLSGPVLLILGWTKSYDEVELFNIEDPDECVFEPVQDTDKD